MRVRPAPWSSSYRNRRATAAGKWTIGSRASRSNRKDHVACAYQRRESRRTGGIHMDRKKASDYPQELLDLFHEYQHGDITRRDFLERARKFAVGGVTAMALFESLKPNYAWAQQVPKDDARIKAGYETVQSPQGNGSIKGYFARPAAAAGKLPAVLLIH